MLFYNRMLEPEGIDVNRTGLDTSKVCSICHFYFFKDRDFLYQLRVCNGCHDASLRAISLTDFKVISIKGYDSYRVIGNLLYNESYHLLE